MFLENNLLNLRWRRGRRACAGRDGILPPHIAATGWGFLVDKDRCLQLQGFTSLLSHEIDFCFRVFQVNGSNMKNNTGLLFVGKVLLATFKCPPTVNASVHVAQSDFQR